MSLCRKLLMVMVANNCYINYGYVDIDIIKSQFTKDLRDTEGGRMLLEN